MALRAAIARVAWRAGRHGGPGPARYTVESCARPSGWIVTVSGRSGLTRHTAGTFSTSASGTDLNYMNSVEANLLADYETSEEAFSAFDLDGSGFIDREEFSE